MPHDRRDSSRHSGGSGGARRHDRHGFGAQDAQRQRRGPARHGERRRPDGDYQDFRGSRGSRDGWEDRRGERGGRDTRRQDGDYQDFRGSRGARGSRDGWEDRRGERGGRPERRGPAAGGARGSRPPQRARVPEPPVPADVLAEHLEAPARRELRALGRANAENVARHLVMVQRLVDTDPETALRHARYAASHAGRVAVVRESAGIAAYLAGHYQEALRDIRAARRLSGLDLHRAIEADCERALGRYDQALKAAKGADPAQLDDVEEAEIAMVVSGIRQEMGHPELGLMVIEEAIMMFRGDRETLRRLHSVRADRLEELGRLEEAEAVRRRIGLGPQPHDDAVEVYDVSEESFEDDIDADDADDADDAADAADAADGPAADEQVAAGQDGEGATEHGAQDAGQAVADDAAWSGSFAERVEAEMAEILGEDVPADDEED